jgi:hypothetical protein
MYLVIVLHCTKIMYEKECFLEFRSSEQNHEKKLNRSEVECFITRSVVQVMMTAVVAHSWGSVYVRRCADWLHGELHIHQPCVYDTKYCWWLITKLQTWRHTYFFLLIFMIKIFAALGDCLVCLVVKMAVRNEVREHTLRIDTNKK